MNKRVIFAIVLVACTLPLAACDDAAAPPPKSEPVEIDDCHDGQPREDGEPCR